MYAMIALDSQSTKSPKRPLLGSELFVGWLREPAEEKSETSLVECSLGDVDERLILRDVERIRRRHREEILVQEFTREAHLRLGHRREQKASIPDPVLPAADTARARTLARSSTSSSKPDAGGALGPGQYVVVNESILELDGQENVRT